MMYVGAQFDVVTGFMLDHSWMWSQDLRQSIVRFGHRIYVGAQMDVVTGFTLEHSEIWSQD